MKRLCIYPKDVERITGKSNRTGRMILEKIRKLLQKETHQAVTPKEFSDYMGIPLDEVLKVLN